MNHFIVTGTGRCGTKLAAELLSGSGAACGHEITFNAKAYEAKVHGKGTIEWNGMVADSSWMALPFLPIADVPVATLTRHPLATVKSFVNIGFFGRDSENPCHKVVKAFAPEVYELSNIADRSLMFWTIWTSAIIEHAEIRFKLEEFGPGQFKRMLRWADCDTADSDGWFANVSKENVNPHKEVKFLYGEEYTPGWSQHSLMIANRAMRLANMIGYRV